MVIYFRYISNRLHTTGRFWILGFCINLSLARCSSMPLISLLTFFVFGDFFNILLTTIDTSRRPRLSLHHTFMWHSWSPSSKNSTSVWVSALWWEWSRTMCEDGERTNPNKMTVKQMVLFNVSYIARVKFGFCRNSKNITVDHTHAAPMWAGRLRKEKKKTSHRHTDKLSSNSKQTKHPIGFDTSDGVRHQPRRNREQREGRSHVKEMTAKTTANTIY